MNKFLGDEEKRKKHSKSNHCKQNFVITFYTAHRLTPSVIVVVLVVNLFLPVFLLVYGLCRFFFLDFENANNF